MIGMHHHPRIYPTPMIYPKDLTRGMARHFNDAVRIRKHSCQRPRLGGQDEIETAIGCIDSTDCTIR